MKDRPDGPPAVHFYAAGEPRQFRAVLAAGGTVPCELLFRFSTACGETVLAFTDHSTDPVFGSEAVYACYQEPPDGNPFERELTFRPITEEAVWDWVERLTDELDARAGAEEDVSATGKSPSRGPCTRS